SGSIRFLALARAPGNGAFSVRRTAASPEPHPRDPSLCGSGHGPAQRRNLLGHARSVDCRGRTAQEGKRDILSWPTAITFSDSCVTNSRSLFVTCALAARKRSFRLPLCSPRLG